MIDAMAECPAVDAAAPPAGAVGLRSRARAHGARLHRGAATRRWWSGCASASPASRSPPTSSSVSRARTTTTSPRPRRSCAASRYDSAFLFRYSRARGHARGQVDGRRARRREGPPARAPDRAPGDDLRRAQSRAASARDVEVLVEGPARRPEGWMSGKTPQMKTVVFPGPAAPGDAGDACASEAATSHTLTGRQAVREVA